MLCHPVASVILCTMLTAVLLNVVGCQQSTPAPLSANSQNTQPAADSVAHTTDAANDFEDQHPHVAGAHGGLIIPIGSDSYHAEAIVDHTGTLRLLMLQKDETRILEVESQMLTAWLKMVGQTDAVSVPLTPQPQDGDAAGMTSQFVAELPHSARGKALDVTIPNLRIAGERFRIGFTTASKQHAADMPASLPADEEQQLYLTAAGNYTDADIKANGSTTAAIRFAGKVSRHDAKPQIGDRICPISRTKANPEFTWIINGLPYQFCCPPCIDEYVRMAKQQPDTIQPPDSFIKQP